MTEAAPEITLAIISRKAAKAAGLKRYYTGKPCKHGHIAERSVSNFGCFACSAIRQKALHLRNPTARKRRFARWYVANKDTFLARKAADRAADPDTFAFRYKRWATANPELVLANVRSREARKKAAVGRHTGDEIKALFKQQRGRCAYCRVSLRKGYHVDHIVPLAKGGSNWIANIQLTCADCNLRKSSRDPILWAQRQFGRLL